jgi:hypothetical protein
LQNLKNDILTVEEIKIVMENPSDQVAKVDISKLQKNDDDPQ